MVELLTPSCGAGTNLVKTSEQLFPTALHQVYRAILSGDIVKSQNPGIQRRVMKLIPSPTPLPPTDHRRTAPAMFDDIIDDLREYGLSSPACYTDGSFKLKEPGDDNVNDVLQQTFRLHHNQASGAAIFTASGDNWASQTIIRVHIANMDELTHSGAFAPELLSIVFAQCIFLELKYMGHIWTDSEASRKALFSNPRSYSRRECAFLLHASQKLYQCNPANILKVAAHPEKRVVDKTLWASEWSRHDWGNYLADKTANGDDDLSDVTHFLTGRHIKHTIQASTLLKTI